MNLHRLPGPLNATPEGLDADVARIAELWAWATAETGGPWLSGAAFSAADVFYVPVAFRLQEYALSGPRTDPYVARLLEHPAVQQWIALAMADPRRISLYDRE